jgi:signal transduction histidine kinase
MLVKNKLFVFLFVYCFASYLSIGQTNSLVDSLLQITDKATNDTVVVRAYKQITDAYIVSDPSKASFYAQIGLEKALKMRWTKAEAVFYSLKASIYSNASNFDSSIFYNKKALVIHQNNKDNFNTSSVYNNLGVIANRQSKYIDAISYYLESLKTAESINNKGLIATAYNNIATVYIAQANYTQALDYNLKALAIKKQEENADGGVADILVSIADNYLLINDSATAYQYYQQALPLYKKVNSLLGEATVFTSMATLANKNYSDKYQYLIKAQNIWEQFNPTHPTAIVNIGNLGVFFMDLFKNKNPLFAKQVALQKANFYLQKAIEAYKQIGDINGEAFYRGNLAEVQKLMGNYKAAYENFVFFQRIQDSIFSQENKNKIADLQAQRELALRDKEIEINKIAFKNQQKLKWALMAGIGLLLTILGLLYNQSKHRKKANEQLLALNTELDEANKVKAKFFGLLSHDLRNPIARLVSFLQIQKDFPEHFNEASIAQHQSKITQSATTLLDKMETLLLWSKGQMQHFKPVNATVAIKQLFEYVQKSFNDTENINWQFITEENLCIHTDEIYLQTIIYNLTLNSINALRQVSHPSIKWQAIKTEQNITLSITDNGSGIVLDKLEVLQNENATISGKNGLGLHLIRDMAKAIGCALLIETSTNGTKISLNLPAS